jgi:menaquinone-9 beta-reductase
LAAWDPLGDHSLRRKSPTIAEFRRVRALDVAILGGGLAGTAASIHLARAGLSVLCIEPAADSPALVGESLDWSAPPLLAELGFPMQRLLDERIATYKKHVVVNLEDGSSREYLPGSWLAKAPWNVEVKTLHVDRAGLRGKLREVADGLGVPVVAGRVASVEANGDRITGLATATDEPIQARWYLDASGLAASLFPRRFRVPARVYGPQKVAIWNYFTVANPVEGTTLHTDCGCRRYMEWIWEIPINPTTVGVGYVAPADVIKTRRQQGLSIEAIYAEALGRIPRLAAQLPAAHLAAPHVVSYRCRVHRRMSGPNWIATGESAAMVDPMTSNGVTAALRHAQEAAHLVIRAGNRAALPRLASALYTRRALDLAQFFNCGIERIVYDWPVRERIGPLTAARAYTVPAWLFNLFYTRLQPRGVFGTYAFSAVLGLLRCAASIAHWFCRRFPRSPAVCAVGAPS